MIIFLLILLLGTFLIFKKIKVNIDFSISGLEYYFCVHISCFKICKTFYKEDILKILYKRKKRLEKNFKNSIENKQKDIEKAKKLKRFKDLKDVFKILENKFSIDKKWTAFNAFKIEKIILNAKVGLGDVFLTSLLIPIISSIFSISFQKYFPQAAKSFSVQPIWNEIHLSIKGSIYSYVRLKDIGYTFFNSWLASKNKNKKIKNN